jgi:2-dehydro-3-deoxyglucarate aldolase/4-hydroxy-2-oxoheptanedioate aldolase
MRANPVKRTLEAGGVAFGTMVTEFATAGVARLAARAGAEFVLYDMEHTGYEFERMRWCIAAARADELVPFLRVPDAEYDFVARALDIGAIGVMVPSIESAEEAQLVADAARYPPVGRRGFGRTFRDDWAAEGIPATLERANEETLVILQVETAAGVEHVEEIAAVDGVDLLWVGHFDLSTSLGAPGEFTAPAYERAVDRILAAADAAGKPVGIVSGTVEDARAALERGFRCIGYMIDVWIYEDALRAGLAQLEELRKAL